MKCLFGLENTLGHDYLVEVFDAAAIVLIGEHVNTTFSEGDKKKY